MYDKLHARKITINAAQKRIMAIHKAKIKYEKK